MVQEAIHDNFVTSLKDKNNLSDSNIVVDELTTDSLNNNSSKTIILAYSSLITTLLGGMGWYIFHKRKSSDV